MPLSRDPGKRRRQLDNLIPGARTAPPGNQRAVSHGGYAAIARAELEDKAREVFEALAADAPLRDGDGSLPAADALAVRLLAEVLIRLDRVRSHVGDFGLLDQESGEVRPVVELEAKLRREAFDYAEALGLTPRSRSRLGLDLARTATSAEEADSARAARQRLDRRAADLDGEAEEVEG